MLHHPLHSHKLRLYDRMGVMNQPMQRRLGLLRRVAYFAGLSEDILTALSSVAIERHYASGQVIFLEGEPCAGLCLVIEGSIKVYRLSPQGREQILQNFVPVETFNEVAVLDGGVNPASASAVSDVTLWVISRPDLRRLALERPALAWALIESIAKRTRHLVSMVEDLALRPVRARLARLLLAEANRTPSDAQIDRSQMVTQAEMAARLGTVREVVGRALRDLADEGLISIDRHRIIIVDRVELQRLADGY